MHVTIDAQKLRLVLIGIIVLVTIASAAGVWLLLNMLDTTRTERAEAYKQMQVLQQEVDNIKSLEKQLAEKQSIIEKAKEVFSTDKLYAYQDKVIEDLNAYAKKNKMSLTSISFGQTNAAKSATSAAPAGAAPVLVPFNVTLAGDSSFVNVMSFLYDIEHSLTQLRIVNTTLSPDPENLSKLTAPSLSLEVYVRSGK